MAAGGPMNSTLTISWKVRIHGWNLQFMPVDLIVVACTLNLVTIVSNDAALLCSF